jgi:hypothetical protein
VLGSGSTSQSRHTLYQLGVNAYLMGYLARHGLFGLTGEVYSARVRASEDAKKR